MNANHACAVHRDVGYSNLCQVCGIPMDAGYFDVASIKAAPPVGKEVELARYQLHPQYCGTLLYFMQYAEESTTNKQVLSNTPGYEWLILCNNQPRAPYLPTSLILNPWGYNSLPIHLRLEEGCTLRFVVRRVAAIVSPELSQVGGRLLGRSWYNTIYGGIPNRL
ncbi:MAG: hypothetical protein CV088_05770 [Nitrospira sp. LK70]|nr:hypothetical protein [Nitrospira sp. LK70]